MLTVLFKWKILQALNLEMCEKCQTKSIPWKKFGCIKLFYNFKAFSLKINKNYKLQAKMKKLHE